MSSLKLYVLSANVALVAVLLFSPNPALAQYTHWLNVNCVLTVDSPPTYASIHAALTAATDRTGIYVYPGSVCNEQASVTNLTNIGIVTDQGSTFKVVGNLSIQSSSSVYIYGAQVSNASGDGIDVSNGKAITLDDCGSSNNSGLGLNLNASEVTVNHLGIFDYNAGGGVVAGLDSTLYFSGWWPNTGVQFEMVGNVGSGLHLDRSVFESTGNTTIANTVPSGGGVFPDAFGLIAFGGSAGGLFGMTGPNVLNNNQGGGIFLAENSEFSVGGGQSWAPYPITVQGNGPFGIFTEFGSQLTVFGGTQILDQTTAGVDIFSNSQAAIYGNNQISHNGTGLDPSRSGILVEGNSHAYVRGATISQNGGPGILNLVNSSVDLGNSTILSNMGGSVTCDGTAVLKSDLPSSVLGSTSACRISAGAGNQRSSNPRTPLADQERWKAFIKKMRALTAAHNQ